jgi:hypothetical protein
MMVFKNTKLEVIGFGSVRKWTLTLTNPNTNVKGKRMA